MLKRESFHIIAVFLVAVLMTAGCAKQEIVKRDEEIVPAPVTKQADQPKSIVTLPKQAATPPLTNVTSSAVPIQQAQNGSSTTQLQSELEKIYFDFDSANLTESARSALTKNTAALMKEPSAKIRIEGNCDEHGSTEYNLALGERRAKSAQQYLITLGVKSDLLSIVSYGKEKPAIRGSDEVAWTKNRRDEFVVMP